MVAAASAASHRHTPRMIRVLGVVALGVVELWRWALWSWELWGWELWSCGVGSCGVGCWELWRCGVYFAASVIHCGGSGSSRTRDGSFFATRQRCSQDGP